MSFNYDTEVREYLGAGRRRAVSGIDANPDDAARSIELSEATGVPAAVIHGDRETFERNTKAQMAGDIVGQNSHLRAYLDKYPLANEVSNDDYAALDEVSEQFKKFGPLGRFSPSAAPTAALHAALSGLKEGWGEQTIGDWIVNSPAGIEFAGKYPGAAANLKLVATPVELVLRGLSAGVKGLIEGGVAGAETLGEQLGMSEAGSKKMGRDVGGMLEMLTNQPTFGMRGEVTKPVIDAIQSKRVLEAVDAGKPWIEAGQVPPYGVHPLWDKAITEQSKINRDNLKELEKASQKPATRERSPVMFENFINEHPDMTIRVEADAVAQLYGDKIPALDDNLLGWVPQIAEQLRVGVTSGGDIEIPIKLWLTKADPEVQKQLHDFVRVHPGDVTKNEVQMMSEIEKVFAEAKKGEPEVAVADELPVIKEDPAVTAVTAIRDNAKFSVPPITPERKLTLKRSGTDASDFHQFELQDEAGKSRGYVILSEQKGGKEIYIEDISGLDRVESANEFGPRMIRDVLRQIKEEFPQAESLTGFRVSGARDKAGTWESHGKATIKLDDPDLDVVVGIIEGVLKRKELGMDIAVEWKPKEAYTKVEEDLVRRINEVLSRIVPKAQGLDVSKIELRGKEVAGLYISKDKLKPIIMVALDARNVEKTARHEAIHFLRDYDFITKDEWSIIEENAKKEDWIKKHNIHVRYERHNMSEEALLEEAVAEEFARWGTETAVARKRYNAAVNGAFEKMAEFFKQILEVLKEAFGHAPKIDELFEMIESGEVGARKPGRTVARRQEKIKASEKEPELPGMTRMEDRLPFSGSIPGWLTMKQRERYMQLIERRQSEDAEALTKRVEAQLERERKAEWKANKAEIKAQVSDGIEARPDIAADNFMANGVLYGEKVPKQALSKAFLTEEQIKALPKEWVSADGIHPDDLAGLFGYNSGAALVDRLAQIATERKQAGMTHLAWKRRVIDLETERIMQERFGETSVEVLEQARDYVLSETQVELLHEQTLATATKAGLEFSITKDELKAAVKNEFENSPLKNASAERFMRDAGKAGRQLEGAFLGNNVSEAFHQSQRQYMSALLAKEAAALEKEAKRFDRLAKRFSTREVKGIDQQYTNFIHQLLLEAEQPVRRDMVDVNESITRDGNTTLEAFVDQKLADGWELDVPDWVLEKGGKPLEQMTVKEFREFHDAIKTLAHVGRAERQVILRGEAMDFADWKADVITNIEELPLRTKEKQMKLLYKMDASLTRIEEVVKDLDLRRQLGPLYRALIEPMVEAKHKEYQLQEALAKELKAMKEGNSEWMRHRNDTVPNDFFIDPNTGVPFDLTRGHLVNIMLNFGNRSNIDKFTKGWAKASDMTPAEFEARMRHLINTNATPEDWAFVQRIGKIFEGWWKEVDTLYHNLSGLTPKKIKLEMIDTPTGQVKGWYFPIIFDKYYSDIIITQERGKSDLFGPDYFKATTGNSYTKERTGAIKPVEFQNSVDFLGTRMQQVMHDISYRAAVMQGRKIISDRQIRSAIRKHYGMEYEAQLDPWLKDIANHYNQNEVANGWANDTLRRARFNLTTHALGWNLKVIGSPDVGALNPKSVASVLSNWTESMKIAEKSLEIPHTYKNMDRDFRERLENLIEKNRWDSFRAEAVRWAFYPLVKVSQGFRIVTFVDLYKKSIAKGMSEADAISYADSEVRLRHGSTGIPDLPAVMRGSEGMKMATTFYGFFNAMYNGQRQLRGNVKRGEWTEGINNLYTYVLIPAIFGAVLFNRPRKDEGFGETAGKALGLQLLGTIPFARDLGSAYFESIRPSTPIGTILSAVTTAANDAGKIFKNKRVEKPIKHGADLAGLTLGLPLGQVGKTGQFIYDVNKRKQHPKNIWDYTRGVIHGDMKLKR